MRITPHPLLLRLPGLRRYAIELQRLQRQLEKSEERVRRLQAREAARRPQLKLLEKATRFDYYWYNAEKKIDLRELDTFGPIAARVVERGRTFLTFDRLYTLWQGVAALPPDATAVAEIGAYRGGSARFVAEAMRARGRELPFYVCDTFRGHTVVDEEVDGWHQVGKQFSSVRVERVQGYLKKFGGVTVVPGDIRETSAQLAGERRFGLVHIDVDVYPITRFCLDFFAPRVVEGGTIVIDDYGFVTCAGAKKAVDEFVAANSRYRLLHLLTGQAVLIPLHP